MADAIDLTLSDEDEAGPALAPAAAGAAAAPARHPAADDCVVVADAPCASCGGVDGSSLACGHALCGACLASKAEAATAGAPTPPRLAALLRCPSAGCGAALGAAEVARLPSAGRVALQRWCARALDASAAAAATSGRAQPPPDVQLARHLQAARAAHWSPGGAGHEGGPKHRAGGGRAAAAGAGVGYGGSAGTTKAQMAARAKVVAAEGAADGALAAALAGAAAALRALPRPLPAAAAAAAGPAGGLPALLRGCVGAASLFEASPGKGALLRAALQAVAAVAAHPLLLPLLCAPEAAAARVPRAALGGGGGGGAKAAGGKRKARPSAAADDDDDGNDGGGGGGGGGGGDEGRSVYDALNALAGQARAALAAGGGGGADDAAAGIVAAADALAAAARAAGLGLGARTRRRRAAAAQADAAAAGGAAAAAAGGAGGAAAAAEAEYVAVMSPQTYDSAPLLGTHYFRRELPGSLGGEAGKQRTRRVVREAAAMRSALPCAFHSTVAVRVDESRPDVLQALVVPHRDTPYANGVFVFDILLPGDYPQSPPRVQLLTTGGGRVRFNPNLYAEGKVCLSLLGTWKGPGWEPAGSTLLQVLISIQSLIFVEKPWFNEPGHERTEGTPQGEAQSGAYSAQLRHDTLAHALLPALLRPPPAFAGLLVQHFRRKHGDIARQLGEWRALARAGRGGPAVGAATLRAADEVEAALARYAPRAAPAGPVETITL